LGKKYHDFESNFWLREHDVYCGAISHTDASSADHIYTM